MRRGTEFAPENRTVEVGRTKRKDRRKRGSGRQPPGHAGTARRAALVSIPAGVITIVVIVLVFFSPFAPPCIRLTTVPASSGTPAFPPSDTADFGGTWCSTAPAVYHVHVSLSIEVGTVTVPVFDRIGINSSYPGGATCFLPIHTHDSSGTLHVESAWPYEYTLGDFFAEWAQSESSIFVNSSFPSQPVNYTGSDLFGLPSGGAHTLLLLVDGEVSMAGPQLDLTKLDNPPGPSPNCLADEYGTGHTVAIVYQ